MAGRRPGRGRPAARAGTAQVERATPKAAKPWGAELTQGWQLARAWRQHNNGNIEIILAEYLTFVALCRRGCAGSTIEGKGYVAMAEQVKNLRGQMGGPYGVATSANAWLATVADPT